MTHHGETQRTSEKAVRKTKHSYNPTNANGYVVKSGTKTDDVLLQFKHKSHFWGYRPIEETRVTGVKWQLCLVSLKQLSSAAYRVSCLLRATPGNVIMDHEFHARGCRAAPGKHYFAESNKITYRYFFITISTCMTHNSRILLKMWLQLFVLQRHKMMRRWLREPENHECLDTTLLFLLQG
jgi:hypothetical protein